MRHLPSYLTFRVSLALAFSPVLADAQATTAAALAAQRYDVDPMHSTVGFATTLMGAVKVRGRFTAYGATIIFDSEHPERSSVSAVIQAKTINTDMDFRDDHLRSPDFFDVEQFPTIEFTSERVAPRRGGGVTISGVLRMHGVSRHVSFPAKMVLAPYTVGSTRGVAFAADLRLSRKDYGIAGTNKFNPDYNPLTSMLSDSVEVLLELDAIRAGYATRTLGMGTPPGVADTLNRVLQAHGAAEAIRTYQSLRASQPAAFNYEAWQLDLLGRQLAERGDLNSALAILAFNAEESPGSEGVLEALGEAQAMANDAPAALATYQRALAKFPRSTDAREMVRHLERLPRAAASGTAPQ
ncbi:MAG: YceI family protein [Gemmatimonadaceae bacterium]